MLRICSRGFSIAVFTFVLIANLTAQSSAKRRTASPDERIYQQRMQMPRGESLPQATMDMAKSFMGSKCPKYISASELEAEDSDVDVELQPMSREYFAISLRLFDCMTLVEASVGLAKTKRSGQPSYSQFKNQVRQMRYANGLVTYSTRLHYFTDWLFENEKRGMLTNISREIGGVPFKKEVNYMSSKRDTFYGNMRDPKTFAAVRSREIAISNRSMWYIPKENVADIEAKLQDGDIIAITNAAEGMDIAHTGFVYKHYDRAHMLHADLELGRVSITSVPLADYLAAHPKHTGVMIARLKE
jgi:hypothetical protein